MKNVNWKNIGTIVVISALTAIVIVPIVAPMVKPVLKKIPVLGGYIS